MADLDVTKKLTVYHLLYLINLSFTNVVRRCAELHRLRWFRPQSLRRWQSFAQEVQCDLNIEIMEDLSSREDKDLGPLEKIRVSWDESGETPERVLLADDGRGRKKKRSAKKHPLQAAALGPAVSNQPKSKAKAKR